jgi:hypothetical protein
VTIPGRGDLVPRRHRAPLTRWLVTALVVLLLGAGGYFAFLGLSSGSSSDKPVATSSSCPKPTVPGPAALDAVHLRVDNATLRNGLAARVSGELKKRGFHVSQIGNTTTGTGVAAVRYSHGLLLEAQAVADQIKGAVLAKTSVPGVELDVGPKFHTLLSPAAATAARATLVAGEVAALPASSVSPCP